VDDGLRRRMTERGELAGHHTVERRLETSAGTESPLLMFHPAGTGSTLVLGGGCPRHLQDRVQHDQESAAADLVILAPVSREQDLPVLGALAHQAADSVRSGGLVYLLAPARVRRGVHALMEQRGMTLAGAVLHAPGFADGRHLIPVASSALRGAAARVTGLRAAAFSAVVRIPGATAMLRKHHPSVALLFQHSSHSTAPPMSWLGDRSGVPLERITISLSWRGAEGSAVALLLDDRSRPSQVVKIALSEQRAAALAREARALESLGPSASAVGIRVPRVRAFRKANPATLEQDYIAGRTAAVVLRSHRLSVNALLEQLAGVLRRWGVATATAETWDAGALERELLQPARRMAPELGNGAEYLASITRLGEAFLGRPLARCVTHGDLTMENVMLRASGDIGLVDWEEAREAGLPLTDFYYAAVDAMLHGGRVRDRPEAFERCYVRASPDRVAVDRLATGIAEALDFRAGAEQVAFHACWLQHATNELDAALPAAPRPFRDILQRIASSSDLFNS
jgi:aminoglycoside phosphotransferase